jgi:hypothetical protein
MKNWGIFFEISIHALHQILLGPSLKNEEARSKHGGDEKCIQNVVENPEGKRQFEGQGIQGKIILKWI